MAKKPEPQPFSPNLFFSSPSQGGLESFGLGNTGGTIPSGPILFPVASSSGSALADPFAAVGETTNQPPQSVAQPVPLQVQAGVTSVASPSPSSAVTTPSTGDTFQTSAAGELETVSLDQPVNPAVSAGDLSASPLTTPYGGVATAPHPQSWGGQPYASYTSSPAPRTLPTSAATFGERPPSAFTAPPPVAYTTPAPVQTQTHVPPVGQDAQPSRGVFQTTEPDGAAGSSQANSFVPSGGSYAAPGPASNIPVSVDQSSWPRQPVMEQFPIRPLLPPQAVDTTGINSFQHQAGPQLQHQAGPQLQHQAGPQLQHQDGPQLQHQSSFPLPPAQDAHEQVPQYVPPGQHQQQYQAPFEQQQQANQPAQPQMHQPVHQPLYHWFYNAAGRWYPMSITDSARLEGAVALSVGQEGLGLIPTDGGRYDVDLVTRTRQAVYFAEEVAEVRRCSWFFRHNVNGVYEPYPEDVSMYLESEYQQACHQGWPRTVELGEGHRVTLHTPATLVHYPPAPSVPAPPELPRHVRRGLEGVDEVEEGEPLDIDHLVFVVDGIGPAADMHFRSIHKCVDDFRQAALEMLQQHFPHRAKQRVEFLPVSWHEALHSDTIGVNRKLREITLSSCSRLRDFVNDTFLDILFYMSPAYCQVIQEAVANEMERMLAIFRSRHPNFSGDVMVIGHSLGSCILFDLLAHQGMQTGAAASLQSEIVDKPQPDTADDNEVDNPADAVEAPKEYSVPETLKMFSLDGYIEKFEAEQVDYNSFKLMDGEDFKELGIPMGPRKKLLAFLRDQVQAEEKYQRELADARARVQAAKAAHEAAKQQQKTAQEELERQAAAGVRRCFFQHPTAGVGQPLVEYPQLSFKPTRCFLLGSPLGMFVAIRGGHLGQEFALPTCPHLVSIFHPFDPVAYRIEPMVESSINLPPVQIPHHKGRKRLHLELRENIGRVSASLKKNLLESMRQTWEAVQNFAKSHRPSSWQQQVVMEQVEQQEREQQQEQAAAVGEAGQLVSDSMEQEVVIGRLNGGRRIDHVLQERPFESFNEYLFALQSHLCYWTSEDSALLMLREIYSSEAAMAPPSNTH